MKLKQLLFSIAFLVLAVTASAQPPYADYYLEAAKKNLGDASVVHVNAYNPDVDTSTDPEDIVSYGGSITWQTSAQRLLVVSTNTNDDSGQSGARTILITGLDSSFAPISEVVTMDGNVDTTTTASFIRVNSVSVVTTGTYHGANAGTISARYLSTNDTAATILSGKGVSETGTYTVPAGKTAYLTSYRPSVSGTKTSEIHLLSSSNASDVTTPFTGFKRSLLTSSGSSGTSPRVQLIPPIRIEEKTDIWWEATEVSADNAAVSVDYTLLISNR